MKIPLVIFCLGFATLPLNAQELKDDALSEQWVDGYLYDFHQRSEEVLGKAPLTVEIYDYSKKKREAKEIEINDSELSRRLVEMILACVKEAAVEQNYVDKTGEYHGRRVSLSSARESMKLMWDVGDFTIGYSLNANGVSIFSEMKVSKKTYIIHSIRRATKSTLSEDIKDRLQPSASHNGGKPPRES